MLIDHGGCFQTKRINLALAKFSPHPQLKFCVSKTPHHDELAAVYVESMTPQQWVLPLIAPS